MRDPPTQQHRYYTGYTNL